MERFLTDETKEMLRRKALTRFRGGMTPYLSKLVHRSEATRRQFIPSWEEGLDFGQDAPFEEGRALHGIYGLERLYEDRVLITPYFDCAAYCRYCFRKTRTIAGDRRLMMPSDIAAACDFISKDKRINTVLITGGDPMADISITENVLRSVAQITNIVNIRIGTRHLLFQPTSFSGRLLGLLREYRKDIYPKNISMYLSFNHPDELTLEVKSAIRRIRDCGIVLRGHTVLLKGVNDKSEIIRDLMSAFVSEEIVPYYLYHCMDVTGTAHLRTSVQRGIDIVSSLATLSGTLAPQYVYVTPVGKHRVFPNKVLDYVEIDGSRYIRSLGPYTASKFKEFTGKTDLPRLHQESDDGLIVSHYLDGNDE